MACWFCIWEACIKAYAPYQTLVGCIAGAWIAINIQAANHTLKQLIRSNQYGIIKRISSL
jgi:hypothetical protein